MEASQSQAQSGPLQRVKAAFDWYWTLSKGGRLAFWSSAGGQALNAFDVAGLSFVIGAITTTFALSSGQAGLLGTVSLLATAVGGTFGGTLADRVGRVRVLLLSISVYGLCTFLAGFAQSYEQLLVLRTLQGLGFGGEWAAGAVLVAEYSRADQRGRVLGAMQSAYAVGYIFLLIAYPIVFHFAPPELAWRIMFWLGVIPMLPLLYLRTRIPESPAFLAEKREQAASTVRLTAEQRFSFLRLFRRDLLAITLVAVVLSIGARGGGTDFWIPSYLEDVRRLAPGAISVFMGMMVVGALIGGIGGGVVADRIGRRGGMATFAIGSTVSIWAYTAVPSGDNALLLLLGLPYAFFTTGILGVLGAWLSEMFPTDARGAGQGFCYNIGVAGSAVGPAMVGVLASSVGLGEALDISGATYLLCLVALPFLPETRGRGLTEAEEAAGVPASLA